MNTLRILLFSALFCSGTAPSIADELVSLDLVRQTSGSTEARLPYEASTVVRVGDRLELVSVDGYDFVLNVLKMTLSPLGNRIIHASTDGGGEALIVADNEGGLLGSITEFGERHQISTSATGQRRIFKAGYRSQEKRMDDGGVPPKDDMSASRIFLDLKEKELSSSPIRAMKAERSSDVIYPIYKTGTAKISVLMYYDDSMSNVFAVIDFITQLAKDAFADSGAKVEIEIVGTKALDVDDDASHYDLKYAMQTGEAPFEEIESDRSFYQADLVFILRDTEAPDGEDPCGIGSYGVYLQKHYRSQFTGLVQWDRYCSNFTFAHEVGHLLGAAHDRADRTEGGEMWLGAYTYSYGTSLDGVFRTVMGVSGFPKRLGLFSSPNLYCNGYPCGKPVSGTDSADNVSAFQSTGHLISSNEGPFAFEAVSTFARRAGEVACTTAGGEAGYWTGAAIRNQSRFSVELVSSHFKRQDGSYAVYEYEAEERVAQPGYVAGGGWCRAEAEQPVFGTTFTEVFMRYRHPETGAIVETESLEASPDYDRRYMTVRVAAGAGGAVSGNPTLSARIDSSHTFTFSPEHGYALASIQSTCSGRKSGNSYTVDVRQNNCFVEATFNNMSATGSESTDGDQGLNDIEAFTERFYTVVLGRDPDQGGFDSWVAGLTGGTLSGSDLARGFFLSPEYTNKQKGDPAFLDDCYQAYFDRAADAGGKQGWLDALAQGMTRTEVLDGFSGSQEFIALAESYGIRPFAGY